MIPFSFIAHLSMTGEWNLLVSFLAQNILVSLLFWQLISVALVISIAVIYFFGKKQRNNMREFMERRTETILDQKNKIEQQNTLLEIESKKSDELLQDIFPNKIIKILKNKGGNISVNNTFIVHLSFFYGIKGGHTIFKLHPHKTIIAFYREYSFGLALIH